MPIPGPNRFRLAPWLAAAAVTVGIVACDTTSSFQPNEQPWGFITLNALNAGGGYRVAPTATFFRGNVSSIPNAAIRTDSCFSVGNYVEPTGTFTGVTFLDAGASITAAFGGVSSTIPRVSASGSTTYNLEAGNTLAFNPGDSVVVTVPGVSGGYPATTLRGKTAEVLTLLQPIEPSDSTIQLRWSAPHDGNGAVIVSLQYTPSGAGARTQEIRCAFTDDGVDSIPRRQHLDWSSVANANRRVVVTRLRTSILAVSGGAMEIISTFQVPTPTP